MTIKTFPICCLALLLALSATAQESDPAAAARTIVENEGKFYRMGQEQNTKAAFLQFLADDAIIFHPGPINARQEWARRPEKGISLKWRPVFAAISRSADLGYTTGPAEWRKEKDDEKPFGYGQFISIWRKQKDGSWKVAVDVGGEVPGPPKAEETEVEYSLSEAPNSATQPNTTNANRLLRNAEGKFANVARTDSTAALLGSASNSVRVQRDGVFPAVGRDAAGLMLSVTRGTLTHEKLGGAMSEAGDLAYSYGRYAQTHGERTEHGHYLQIWRLEAGGTFKIALDYQAPLPNEQKH
ncbi:MAG: nuclear transport factor 2 family protein [Verrucomicrobiota bacterium]|nr:nuclear transport factor 2 family protein [Verrucomicrobiota bacterium]